jgi:hypothetical protein
VCCLCILWCTYFREYPFTRFNFILIGIVRGGVQLCPLGTAATNRPNVTPPVDYDDAEIGGMLIGRGNRSTRRKISPVPLCPLQTPHAARTRTRATAVGSQQVTAFTRLQRTSVMTYALPPPPSIRYNEGFAPFQFSCYFLFPISKILSVFPMSQICSPHITKE